MKLNNKITGTYVVFIVVCTILFLTGHIGSLFGWYYIPAKAINITMFICLAWLIFGVIIARRIICCLPENQSRITKNIEKIIVIVCGVVCGIFLLGMCFSYSFKLEEKVMQYDEHIALYVRNTFVRVEHRNPHYMYEENLLAQLFHMQIFDKVLFVILYYNK